MRFYLTAGLASLVLLAASPVWAGRATDDTARTATIELAALTAPAATPVTSACGEPSEIGANDDCTLALDDEVMLAAELLIAKLGPSALDFAIERAEHHKQDNDSDAADLWRRIADTLGEMAALSRSSM